MNTELLNTVTKTFQPALEAVRTLGNLNVATLEKVTQVQLASVKANVETAIANAKAGIEVVDLDSAKAYATRQNEVVKTVYERLVADSKTLAGIAKDYSEGVSALVK